MPYQSEDCVIHGFEFLNEINDDDVFTTCHIGTMMTNRSLILSQRLRMKMNQTFFNRTLSLTAYWAL